MIEARGDRDRRSAARGRRRRRRLSLSAQVYRIEDARGRGDRPARPKCASIRFFGIRRRRSRAFARCRSGSPSRVSRCVCERRRSCARKSVRAFRSGSTSDCRCSAVTSVSSHELARAGTRRRRRLRGQRVQRAHRGRSLPPRRAAHRRVGRADDRRAVAARRAVGRRADSTCSSTAGPRG